MQTQTVFEQLEANGLTLVKGSLQAPGLFILQQCVRVLLQRGYMVVLVAAEQSLEHYKHVTKKTGLNLQSFQQSGHFVCVEPPLAPVGFGAAPQQSQSMRPIDNPSARQPPPAECQASASTGRSPAGGAARAESGGCPGSADEAGSLGGDAATCSSGSCSVSGGAAGGCAGGGRGGPGGGDGSNCNGRGGVGSGGAGLRELFAAVQGAAERRPRDATGVAVLIDSLTALAALCPSREEWTAFLHYTCCSCPIGAPALSPPAMGGGGDGSVAGGALTGGGAGTGANGAAQAMAQTTGQQVPYCVVACVYDDVPDDRQWLASLEHRANVVVAVEPLPGKIADVDGVVTVTQRCMPETPGNGAAAQGALRAVSPQMAAVAAAAPLPLRQSLYFRSTELAVKWMPTVTARELL